MLTTLRTRDRDVQPLIVMQSVSAVYSAKFHNSTCHSQSECLFEPTREDHPIWTVRRLLQTYLHPMIHLKLFKGLRRMPQSIEFLRESELRRPLNIIIDEDHNKLMWFLLYVLHVLKCLMR